MIKRNLKEITEMVEGSNLKKDYDKLTINGVSTDTRKIKPQQLFIPLKGENFNGHNFLKEAIRKGAIAALWNKDEPVPSLDFPIILVDDTLVALQKLAKSYREELDIKVIGITGSNGKTSTKDILSSILSKKYKTQRTLGNLNNHIGTPLTILSLEEDTEVAVIEMGTSNFGEIELLSSIAKPEVAIITNIGEAHLEDLITRDNIAKAKLEIIDHLDPNGLFVYLGDEPLLQNYIDNTNVKFQTISYGKKDFNNYTPKLMNINEEGISFKLVGTNYPDFRLPLLGKHQMYNATAAIIVALHFKIPLEEIQKGLLEIDATGMRNELIHTEKCTILNDAYKSNPSSVLVALDTLKSINKYNKKIVVLGDMLGLGEKEIDMHKQIGKAINPDDINYLFTIGPLGEYIGEGAKSNFPENKIFTFLDKSKLIDQLQKVVDQDTIVLIKASRGLELEDIVDALK